MKKGLISLPLFIMSLGLIAAQGFSSLSFGGIFSYFDTSFFIMALFFAIIFALVYVLLSRGPLGDNEVVVWIISFCVSGLAIFGIESTGFSPENLLYSIGISSSILPTVLWMAGVVLALILLKKFKLRNFIALILFAIGALFIILSLLGVFYEGVAGFIIGAVLILIALFVHKRMAGPTGRGLRKVGNWGWHGMKGVGNAGWGFGKWAGGKIPARNIFNSMKGIAKKIAKLKKKYSKAIAKNDMVRAEDIRKQIDYLETKLNYEGREVQMIQKQEKSSGTLLVPQDKGQIKKSIRILVEEYNKISGSNPRDPRLLKIVDDIKELKRRL